MSKKILSFALVAVMLLSMFSLTASAVAAGEPLDSIGIKVVSDVAVGATAGTPFEVKVYYTVPEGTDISEYTHGIGNITVCWNKSVFAIDSTNTTNAKDAIVWNDYYAEYINTAGNVTIAATIFNNVSKLFNETDATYGWTAAAQVQIGYNNNNGYSNQTGFPLSPENEIFTLKFKVADGATVGENDVIGVSEGACNNGTKTFFRIQYNNGTTQVAYDVNNIDFSESVAYPVAAAEPAVSHEKTMGHMKDWTDASATTFNAGFVGRISNVDAKIGTDGESAGIKSIVVEVTRGDVTLTGNAYQIYAQADGSYLFRAVVNGASISDAEEISYKYIVTLDDGSELTAEGTTSFKAIYDTAKANYDAANA